MVDGPEISSPRQLQAEQIGFVSHNTEPTGPRIWGQGAGFDGWQPQGRSPWGWRIGPSLRPSPTPAHARVEAATRTDQIGFVSHDSPRSPCEVRRGRPLCLPSEGDHRGSPLRSRPASKQLRLVCTNEPNFLPSRHWLGCSVYLISLCVYFLSYIQDAFARPFVPRFMCFQPYFLQDTVDTRLPHEQRSRPASHRGHYGFPC